ncbi:MAG TPA: Ppx/GppA phosphatase family protein [Xanthobacteraceae bacterium]|jgi:exopolyphosphatase/guanosine-5'-triphosphate,3'-diphosphate pyrophosphatase
MAEEGRDTGLGPGSDRTPWHKRDRPPAQRPSRHGCVPGTDLSGPTYGALDLGTNNCRLLIARPTRDGFRVIDAFSRIIRLGEGISASGQLGDGAIERALEALTVCRDKMRNRGVTRARLIATEACRSAGNAANFLALVNDRLGMKLEIVDRETEAILAATGCTPLVDPAAEGVILFDIGGGSSELVQLGRPLPARRGPPVPEIRSWISLPVGVVTLAERYGGIRVDRELFEQMVAEVALFVASFAARHGPLVDGVHMLGTSGTVTTIAGVHLELARYDRRRVDGCWLTTGEVTEVIERLLAMSYEDRVASPCIGAERADLVLAGCAILEAIRRAFPCPRLRVADRGLREGMLVQMMREDGVWGATEEVS